MNTHPSISHLGPSPADDDDTRAESFETDISEEEIDQLDSDSDEDVRMADASSSPKRTRPKMTGERVPGRSIIPLSRVEGLLEADGEGGYMSKEATYLLTIATEEFIKRLSVAGHRQASGSKRLQVNYRDLAITAHQHPEFKFLSDTIPEPISLADALKLRASKEKELLEDGPVTAAPSIVHTPTPSTTPSIPQPSKAKGKARQSVEQSADSVSAEVPKKPRQRKSRAAAATATTVPIVGPTPDVVPIQSASTGGMTTRRRSSRAAALDTAQPAGPDINGHRSLNGAESASHPQFLHPSAAASSMPPPSITGGSPPSEGLINGRSWSPIQAQFTGPASGYVEESRGSFIGRNGANGMSANPGRTIYSTHRQQSR
ncbi:hypothetical protein QCA50_006656 [Cerrena zonata]|uniref:Transcription factor CBF/NF-Y/archaeal histone domain-containing protein n=1 Tax=Cerrena zonata TaxID=2478898 RepID=A0AAW0GE36_9APHY